MLKCSHDHRYYVFKYLRPNIHISFLTPRLSRQGIYNQEHHRMLLEGKDIASYIQQRHYQQLKLMAIRPKLAIIHASSDPATETYLKAKQLYGQDVGIEVEVVRPDPTTAGIIEQIKRLNRDQNVHGIIVQLPLPKTVDTDQVINAIAPNKDVDGLSPNSPYQPATPTGILWLLAGHRIDCHGKVIAVVGQGRLVGAPVSRMLEASGSEVVRCDITTRDLAAQTLAADIIITATGEPELIKPGMVKAGAVVIDAAGDVDAALMQDSSLKITPARGGVGPMTVAALFDNLIRAAQAVQSGT
jgi:methylenetetrahydrofolate dehydrogenase (NADP+) / methenyltetrahydrofolate cyclohydrolase